MQTSFMWLDLQLLSYHCYNFLPTPSSLQIVVQPENRPRSLMDQRMQPYRVEASCGLKNLKHIHLCMKLHK